MPIEVIRDAVEKQFCNSFDEIFDFFEVEPVGSASTEQGSYFLLTSVESIT